MTKRPFGCVRSNGLIAGPNRLFGASRLNKLLELVLPMILAAMPMAGGPPPAKTETPQDITFTKDIAPILQRSCQRCHRPNNIAPMSLLTYNDARPWARAIREAVLK